MYLREIRSLHSEASFATNCGRLLDCMTAKLPSPHDLSTQFSQTIMTCIDRVVYSGLESDPVMNVNYDPVGS